MYSTQMDFALGSSSEYWQFERVRTLLFFPGEPGTFVVHAILLVEQVAGAATARGIPGAAGVRR